MRLPEREDVTVTDIRVKKHEVIMERVAHDYTVILSHPVTVIPIVLRVQIHAEPHLHESTTFCTS